MKNSDSGYWIFKKTSYRVYMNCWSNIKETVVLSFSDQEKRQMIILKSIYGVRTRAGSVTDKTVIVIWKGINNFTQMVGGT